jgi:hypothetical protein
MNLFPVATSSPARKEARKVLRVTAMLASRETRSKSRARRLRVCRGEDRPPEGAP